MMHNFHTHSSFCDGKEEPELYVKEAIKQDMRILGFSGHAPMSLEMDWCIKYEYFDKYCDTIRFLQEKYKEQITIYLGLEIDYIPGVTKPFDEFINNNYLDYTIGSVHLVKTENIQGFWFIDGPEDNYIRGFAKLFDGNICNAVSVYYNQICEMVTTQKPDIIGHLDKVKMNNKNRFFDEDDGWYKKIVSDTLKVIADAGSIIEVNTSGIYKKKTTSLYPSTHILEQCYLLNIPVTINSDAHSPTDLTKYFRETMVILKDIGYKGIYVLNNKKWELKKFDELLR